MEPRLFDFRSSGELGYSTFLLFLSGLLWLWWHESPYWGRIAGGVKSRIGQKDEVLIIELQNWRKKNQCNLQILLKSLRFCVYETNYATPTFLSFFFFSDPNYLVTIPSFCSRCIRFGQLFIYNFILHIYEYIKYYTRSVILICMK